MSMTSPETSGGREDANFWRSVKVFPRTRQDNSQGLAVVALSVVVPLSLPVVSPSLSSLTSPYKLIRIKSIARVEQDFWLTCMSKKRLGGMSSRVRGSPPLPLHPLPMVVGPLCIFLSPILSLALSWHLKRNMRP